VGGTGGASGGTGVGNNISRNRLNID
jgi:hypothetical protein